MKPNVDGQTPPTKAALPEQALSQRFAPLTLWRKMPADKFDMPTAAVLREALAGIAIIGEPTWEAAAMGDSEAAVGLALRLHPRKSAAMAYDLVMTALAMCGANDDANACFVMAHVLRNRRRDSQTYARLATGWLTRGFVLTKPGASA
jgi:hypothetical protein